MAKKRMDRREFLKFIFASAAAAGLSHFRVLNFSGIVPVSAEDQILEDGCDPYQGIPDECDGVVDSDDICAPSEGEKDDCQVAPDEPDICSTSEADECLFLEGDSDMCPDLSPTTTSDVCEPTQGESDACVPPQDPDECVGGPGDPQDVCDSEDGDVCDPGTDPDVCEGDPPQEPDTCGATNPDYCTPIGQDDADICPEPDVIGDGDICVPDVEPDVCDPQNGEPDFCDIGTIGADPDQCGEPGIPDACETGGGSTQGDPDICAGQAGNIDFCDPPGGDNDLVNVVKFGGMHGQSGVLPLLGTAAAAALGAAALRRREEDADDPD